MRRKVKMAHSRRKMNNPMRTLSFQTVILMKMKTTILVQTLVVNLWWMKAWIGTRWRKGLMRMIREQQSGDKRTETVNGELL